MTRQSESAIEVLIRNAGIDESSSIASVLWQAFIEYESLYTPAGFAATTPSADQIRERWNEGPVWVAVQNGDIVGTVAVVPKGSGSICSKYGCSSRCKRTGDRWGTVERDRALCNQSSSHKSVPQHHAVPKRGYSLI